MVRHHGLTSEWLPVKAGVLQESIFGPFFSLFYIEFFADDTSLFIHDAKTTA